MNKSIDIFIILHYVQNISENNQISNTYVFSQRTYVRTNLAMPWYQIESEGKCKAGYFLEGDWIAADDLRDAGNLCRVGACLFQLCWWGARAEGTDWENVRQNGEAFEKNVQFNKFHFTVFNKKIGLSYRVILASV